MERSFGADALLNESWATPWLDEGVFPYWSQAVSFGDLEDFFRWLVVQDSRRAALVLNHAREFEKVHHLVTTELSRPKRQEEQQQQRQQPYRQGGQTPRPWASSTSVGMEMRGGTARGPPAQALASSGGGEERRRGPGGGRNKTSSPPFRNSKITNVALDASSSSHQSSDARRSKRLFASGGSGSGGGRGGRGVGGGERDRVGGGRAATSVMPPSGSYSWPLPPNLFSAPVSRQHDERNSRHKTRSSIPSSEALGFSSRRRGTPAPRSRVAAQMASSTSSAAAVVGYYRRPDAPAASDNPRRTTRQWSNLRVGAGGAVTGNLGVGGSSRSSSSGGGNGNDNGNSSRRGSSSGSMGASGSRSGGGSSSSGRSGTKMTSREAHGPGAAAGGRPGFSSWAAMAAAVVATEAAGKTATVRQAVEAAAAEAEAAENHVGTGQGKRGRGILSPEKQFSGRAGGLARRSSRRSSTPTAWDKSNGNGLKGGGVTRIRRNLRKDMPVNLGLSTPASDLDVGERSSPLRVAGPTPAGSVNGHREVGERVSPSEHRQQVQFLRSPRSLLRDIDETKEEGEEEDEEEEKEEEGEEEGQEGGGQSWLSMRDPVSLREFWFDPETRAAEWEGGGAMEDAPGGMGLGLLSQEDRERLRGKFERRQRRVRRATGVAGGGRGTPRGTAGLREKVLRKLALDGGTGRAGAGAGGAEVVAKAAPAQRGADTQGVFFS